MQGPGALAHVNRGTTTGEDRRVLFRIVALNVPLTAFSRMQRDDLRVRP